MAKEDKQTLTPKLRFPEFRKGKGWVKANLGTVLRFQPGFPFPSAGFNDDGNGVRLIRNRDLRSDEKIIFYAGSFDENFVVNNGDILVGMDGDFTPSVWNRGRALLNQRVGRVLPKEGSDQRFLLYFLDAHLKDIEEATARTTVKHLSHADVEKIDEPLPVKAEQQKIADCLTSLDEVIAAQGRKVEALKAHKKGLMQQLFPREGETLPRLRFPEFRGKPEWEERDLASICQIQRGKFSHRPRNDPKFFNGPYPFIQTGDVVRANGGSVVGSQSLNELGLSMSKLFKPTIVLITIAANIGDTAILDSEACFTDSVVGLIPKDGAVTARFLESVVRFKKDYLNSVATTGAQKNINNEILSALVVLIPSIHEQSRIEACLSSLDARLAAETEKLAAFKTHKQALMQQLFPSPEAVET